MLPTAIGSGSVDSALTLEQAEQAQVYLRAMAAAIDRIGHSNDVDQRRTHWFAFEENQAKLHDLLPMLGDPNADEGPYTSET